MFFYVIFTTGLIAQSRNFWRQSIILLLMALALVPFYWTVRDPVLAFYTKPIIVEFALGMAVGLSWDWLAERKAIAKYLQAALVISALTLVISSPASPLLSAALIVLAVIAVVTVGLVLRRWLSCRSLGRHEH